MIRTAIRPLAVCLALAMAGGASAQEPAMAGEPAMAPAPAIPRAGYLGGAGPEAGAFLPSPPARDSAEGLADMQTFRDTRALEDGERWAMAARDAAGDTDSMLQTFSCALGVETTAAEAPALARLLSGGVADIGPIVGAQKDHFARLRPFAYEEGALCVAADGLSPNGSYPSGHATLGWIYGLLLAELAPDRAGPVIGRGRAFAESRVVCGMHYPSDIEAGQIVAAAVFAAMQSSPAFQADLEAARAELEALRTDGSRPDPARCAAEDAVSGPTPWR